MYNCIVEKNYLTVKGDHAQVTVQFHTVPFQPLTFNL